MIKTPLNVLDKLKSRIFHTQNPLLRKFFPYSTERLLGLITAQELDELFFKIAEYLKVKHLIECGAHGAEASIRFIKQGGKAIAIEANPYIFKNKTPKSTSRLKSLNIALSENRETLIFHVPKLDKESAQSTFLPKNDIEYEKIQVNTERLATILDSNSIKNDEIALWIDVEGMQKEVLRSSDNFLKDNCRLIKIEVETKELFNGQKWLCPDIINFLSHNNFIPIYRDFEYIDQFNVLLIKNKYEDDFNHLVEESINRIKNEVSLLEIIIFLKKFNNLKREIKQVIINLFGDKIGNKIAKKLGSKNYVNVLK